MATDIAFALGILSIFGRRAPSGVGLTLLTLAIVDDLGAILVIAIFYSHGFSVASFLGAIALIGGARRLPYFATTDSSNLSIQRWRCAPILTGS